MLFGVRHAAIGARPIDSDEFTRGDRLARRNSPICEITGLDQHAVAVIFDDLKSKICLPGRGVAVLHELSNVEGHGRIITYAARRSRPPM